MVPASPQQLELPYYNPDFWVNQLPYQSAQSRLVYAKLKRAIDITLVLLSLPFTLPMGLLIALIILIEDGRPILFAQKRTGYGGQVFKMYKFRSMIPNAEARMAELGVSVNERGETVDENGNKLENDPRITRIGKILRKTSLDELPQLWNVFRGQMSIVGPRPTSFGLNSYTLLHTQRLSVRPGITGLWQIYDRGDTDFNNRLIWDIKYIEKLSLSLDSQIVIRTFLRVLKQHGAR
jgi:lipopolysaccharide/colanic/teichoic acid biosynthesis glycosyltransferase